MALFGESQEERRLRSELAEARAMAATYRQDADTSRDHTVQLSEQLKHAKSANLITDIASRALTEAEQSGEVQISAEDAAMGVVKKRFVDQASGVIANQIIDERSDVIRAQHTPEWIEEMKERVRQQYESDGTFETIEKDVTAEAVRTIAEELRAEYRESVVHENDNPEKREEIKRKAGELLEQEGYRRSLEAELHRQWSEEAREATRDEIEQNVRATEADFKERWKKQWRESADGQYHEQTRRRHYEQIWAGKSREEVASQVDDEVLNELLKERANREKQALEKEAFYDEYLADFTGSGIDVDKIPEGATVTLLLGNVEAQVEKDYYGNIKSRKNAINLKRRIKLTSLGDGRFRVESDSMSESNSPHEKEEVARTAGEVIYIGRKSVDKTTNGHDEPILEHTLRSDVPLWIDDDKKDPKITPAYYPLANILINGISARKDLK